MKPAAKYLKNGRIDFDEFFERNPEEFDDDDFEEFIAKQREDRAIWKGQKDE